MNTDLRVKAINEALTLDQCREIVSAKWAGRSEKQIEEGAKTLFSFCQQWASGHHTQFDLSRI